MMLLPQLLNHNISAEQSKNHLRIFLIVFVLILSIPIALLISRGYEQSKKEEFHKYQWHARQVVHQVNDTIFSRLQEEQHRPFDEYSFYKISASPIVNSKQLTLSPLANIPDPSKLPGIIGYFQVDDSGLYSCPHLPLAETTDLVNETKNLAPSFDPSDIQKRLNLRDIIRPILFDNDFIKTTEYVETDPGFIDRMNNFDAGGPDTPTDNGNTEIIIRVEALQLTYSHDGVLIFHRNVWRGSKKLVQGFVVKTNDFLVKAIESILKDSNFEEELTLKLTYKDEVINNLLFSIDTNNQVEVARSSTTPSLPLKVLSSPLAEPLQGISLTFTARTVPIGLQSTTITFLLITIIGITLSGFILIYRIGCKQIDLNKQRLNFVSSISHELKTPLTSILLYAEMLRENMVADEKKKASYYDFIFFESERLSRLIANVLRLSKLERDVPAALDYVRVSSAVETIQKKVSTLLENRKFELIVNCDAPDCDELEILIDTDAFTQVFVNLVDNAIKFSLDCPSNNYQIRLNVGRERDRPDFIYFKLRDHGPGVAKEDASYIFEIFYRAGDELTRKTQGTGIGLSLVDELMQAMGGTVTFKNAHPGAEFIVHFPMKKHC